MGLSEKKKLLVKQTLTVSLRNKFLNYRPETKFMPFHYRLLGKDRMALYSFIQSLNTTFGVSIYEPVAIELAKDRFKVTKSRIKPHNQISLAAQQTIQNIIDDLTSETRIPNREIEYDEIRAVCKIEPIRTIKPGLVDIWLEDSKGDKYLIDLKTVKPNIENFISYKRKILEWVAQELLLNTDKKVHTIIGIPYNPYHPEPYVRWTMRGMFDVRSEILVADELWDFIGGDGVYDDLLDCFEQAGIELRPEIDEHFAKFMNF